MVRVILIFFIGWLIITDACSQPQFSITLKVEGNTAYTAYHDEPLIFSISLLNKALQKNMEWNQAADEWLSELSADRKAGKLSEADFENESASVIKGKKTIKADTIGTYGEPWFNQIKYTVLSKDSFFQHSWPIKVLNDFFKDSIAVLDEKGYYLIKAHLDPATVEKIKPGTYLVKVLLEGIGSNPVTITIKPQNIPPGVFNSRQMQLRLGNYYLQTSDAEGARQFAEKILKKNPIDLGGLILRGESYVLNKNYTLALSDFERALQQYAKKFRGPEQEPPEYLEDTISWLKTRAGATDLPE